MAGRGPTPKDPSQRRRTNAETRHEVPEVVDEPLGPALPGGHDDRTVAWYETWRRVPVATRFLATDWQRLHMLAHVVDAFYAGDTKLLTEIRLNESLLDATTGDRARSKVDVKRTPAAPAPVASAAERRQRIKLA